MAEQNLLPETHCLRCSATISAATAIKHESAPGPGDWSICLECGDLAKFTAAMGLRVPTIAEIAELPPDQRKEIKRIQEKIVLQRGVVVAELENTPANRLKIEAYRRQREARMEPTVVLLNSPKKKRS